MRKAMLLLCTLALVLGLSGRAYAEETDNVPETAAPTQGCPHLQTTMEQGDAQCHVITCSQCGHLLYLQHLWGIQNRGTVL